MMLSFVLGGEIGRNSFHSKCEMLFKDKYVDTAEHSDFILLVAINHVLLFKNLIE